ncbi:MAG: RIP metalloprotease RseP [Methylococcales bacterium]|nr:RIP metalloprotease RseP [Methylococcales bacterium]
MDFLHTVFFFIIAIGLLVAFHEFGHFWVARKVGVKVLRFSIGFGKVVWSYQKNAATTEYALSAIPLGGYVKMVDEREATVNQDDLPFAFNRQSLWARSAIVLAGPVFNLLLAIFLYWSVFLIGEEGMRPVLGPVAINTLAANAGFDAGDEILTVNQHATPTWSEAITQIIESVMAGDSDIQLSVKATDQQLVLRTLTIPPAMAQTPDLLYKELGLQPWTPTLKPIIGTVLPSSAAMSAGLQPNDLIISADGVAINDWMQWVEYVKKRPDITIALLVERSGVQLKLSLTPKAEVQEGQQVTGKIGAGVFVPKDVMASMQINYTLPVFEAFTAACQRTWNYSMATLNVMGQMVMGKASVENLSGPISIAQYAGQSASMGLVQFLKFLAVVSVSLGVMNLLPVPMLDGGHLLLYVIEGVKGSPVSDQAQLLFQQIGTALLMTLMALAMFLDVQRLFH